MVDFLNLIDGYVWGPPLLLLLVGTGVFMTIRTGFVQILRLPLAFKLIFSTGKIRMQAMYPALNLCARHWLQRSAPAIS